LHQAREKHAIVVSSDREVYAPDFEGRTPPAHPSHDIVNGECQWCGLRPHWPGIARICKAPVHFSDETMGKHDAKLPEAVAEATVIILELRAQGVSLRVISAELARRGYPGWGRHRVHTVIKRAP
jgi:hypothetical protein